MDPRRRPADQCLGVAVAFGFLVGFGVFVGFGLGVGVGVAVGAGVGVGLMTATTGGALGVGRRSRAAPPTSASDNATAVTPIARGDG